MDNITTIMEDCDAYFQVCPLWVQVDFSYSGHEYVKLMSETCDFVHKTQTGIQQGTLDPKKVL